MEAACRSPARFGYTPSRRIVDAYRAKGATFVVFTVNDALWAKLYLGAGFSAIGTDDPRFLVELVLRLNPSGRPAWGNPHKTSAPG